MSKPARKGHQAGITPFVDAYTNCVFTNCSSGAADAHFTEGHSVNRVDSAAQAQCPHAQTESVIQEHKAE